MQPPLTVQGIADLIRHNLLCLVDDVDAVQVTPIEGQESVVFEVAVASKDIGKVIGKSGRHLQAIQTLIHAANRKIGKRCTMQLLGTFGASKERGEDGISWPDP